MRRREFLVRSGLGLAALLAPRLARGQPADSTRAAPADSAAVPTAPAVAPSPPPSLLLAAAGDTTLGYNLEAHLDEQLAAGVPGERLWPLYFAGVRPVLAAADLAVVNLECPFTTRRKRLPKNFNFRARPELVEILRAGAVGAVALANNHLKDFGDAGVRDTLAVLDAAGIPHFGAGRNLEAAREPAIVERNGLRLGLLAYYFQSAADMYEPPAVFATGRRAGVAGCYADLECMRRQVGEDLPRLVPRVDAAVVCFHWGKEGSTEVQDYQVDLAHLCVDLGCRAVLGTHPHRLQGVEVYRDAPIFYSLGNFVFGGNKDPRDKLSAIARLRLTRAGVAEADLVPIQITRWPEAPFQPFVLEGAERDAALARVAALSRGFERTLPQLEPLRALPEPAPAPADSSGGDPR